MELLFGYLAINKSFRRSHTMEPSPQWIYRGIRIAAIVNLVSTSHLDIPFHMRKVVGYQQLITLSPPRTVIEICMWVVTVSIENKAVLDVFQSDHVALSLDVMPASMRYEIAKMSTTETIISP